MSKAVEGAALLGGAVLVGGAMFALAATGVGLAALPFLTEAMASMIMGGLSMEAGAISDALTSGRGMNITTRQPASARQVIFGQQRVGGVEIYRSTTGSDKDQFNYVIVLAGHECDSIVNLYLDGRQVHWNVGGVGNVTRNGVNFGGTANSNSYPGPNGVQYNFGGKVYCEACFGNQTNQPNTSYNGGFNTGLQANDPVWGPSAQGIPYVGGCCYVYLKIEYDTNLFPGEPEIRFTVNGKNNIFDPRTNTSGFTTNWALICADVLTDTVFGLGDNSVNHDQLIAAANVCDEQVALAKGGTEARYATNYHCDTTVAPGDMLAAMMSGAAGRLSRIGGEWFIWPAYWQGPSFAFDENALTGSMQWSPYRSASELINRVNGTYTAPTYPYNAAGNVYDANGFYNGQIQNNFSFAFQSTNYPQYACDVAHGYAADQYLNEDGGIQRPRELGLTTVLSVTQAQRVAKITLLRNRQQGSGLFPINLAAWSMQPLDVMQFSFAHNGWTAKMLEIGGVDFVVADNGDGNQSVRCEMKVQETAATVYQWSTVEEMTVYDVPASATQTTYVPASPTNLSVTSSAGTALVGLDGVVHPRALLSWDEPLDGLVKQIQVQYLPGNPVSIATTAATSAIEARTNWMQPGNVGDLPTGGNTSHTGGYGTYTPASGSVGYGIFHAYPNYDYQGFYFYENEPSSFNTMVNFTSTKMIQIPTSGDLAACQALDFEIQVSRAGWTYNGAWEQAPFVSNGGINGVWQYFNYQGTSAPNAHWVPTTIPIAASFVAGQWVAITAIWRLDPVAHTMTHVSLAINGTVYPVNVTQPAIQEGFADYLHASQQLNCRQGYTHPPFNGSTYTPPAAYQTWVKGWTISMDDGKGNAATSWLAAPNVDVANTSCFISDVIAGQMYSFRVRSQRPNGASSPWVELDGYTVSVTLSSLSQTGIGVGSLIGEAFSFGAAIVCSGFTASVGNAHVSVLPNGYTINGLNTSQLYYVYYVDPNFTGGNVTPIATQNQADFRNKVGYFLIDSIVTPAYRSSTGSGSGARFSPSNFADMGTRTTGSPEAAYDGDTTTYANVSAVYDHVLDRGNFGECQWLGFQSFVSSTAVTLHVIASVYESPGNQIACTIAGSAGGVALSLMSANATTASTDYIATIPAGTNLNTVSVTAMVDATAASSTTNLTASLKIAEIYIQ